MARPPITADLLWRRLRWISQSIPGGAEQTARVQNGCGQYGRSLAKPRLSPYPDRLMVF